MAGRGQLEVRIVIDQILITLGTSKSKLTWFRRSLHSGVCPFHDYDSIFTTRKPGYDVQLVLTDQVTTSRFCCNWWTDCHLVKLSKSASNFPLTDEPNLIRAGTDCVLPITIMWEEKKGSSDLKHSYLKWYSFSFSTEQLWTSGIHCCRHNL